MKNQEPQRMLSGPRGHWLLGSLRERNKNAYEFFQNCYREHGDFFKVRMLHIPVFIIARPDLAREVLVERSETFIRKRVFQELSTLLGRGLLTTDGDVWRKKRRLMQPSFHQKNLENFFWVMRRNAFEMCDKIQNTHLQEPVDLVPELMKATLAVVSECLFGFDTTSRSEEISHAVASILPKLFYRLEVPPFFNHLPTSANREFNKQLDVLDSIIFSILKTRRNSKVEAKDLLSLLINTQDESGQPGFNDQELRDEVMTLFLAGHETTANGLAWTFHLLSENPDYILKVQEEVDRVLGDRPIELTDLKNLEWTRMVFEEAIRIYPPIWATPRTAIAETELAGVKIPKGAIVSVHTLLMHRNEKYFARPMEFRPERFLPENRKSMDKFAYIPFAAGPHTCIGNHFALMEAQVILASFFQRFSFEKSMAAPTIQPRATITLRPDPGIILRLSPRERSQTN